LPPPPAEGDDEFDELPERKIAVIPRKGVTTREAQRDYDRFIKMKGRASGINSGSNFGEYIKQKGKDKYGIALQVYAADKMKERIEKCAEMSDAIDNPEIQVRLEEVLHDLCVDIAKVGQGLCKNEPDAPNANANNAPTVNPFPANVAVSIVNHAQPEPAKAIDVESAAS
jgi:hypothetical protein